MTGCVQTILRAAGHLAARQRLTYRERLQLERAVFRLTSTHTLQLFGWNLQSMTMDARDQLLAYLKTTGIEPDDARLAIVHRAFTIMALISSIANVDPYVLNENISRIIHRYSTGVATLPSILHEFVEANQLHGSQ